jgi:curli biogenesis system outer membrane secretion channel CsgG
LGQTGYINPQTAAETGKMIGAKAVVFGQVTEFGIRKVGMYAGVYGQRNITTRIVIDVKMVDTETGEIIGAASGEGTVTTSTAGVAFVWEEGVEQFDQTTVGKASRQAIYKIARQLALQYERKL